MNKGFTIIETLVAIAVLMIGVAGPLAVASKGLSSALNARDQMIASFLAQESMEVIKNSKFNHYDGTPLGWLTDFTLSGTHCDGLGAFCDASAIDSPQIKTCPDAKGCPLFVNANGDYSHLAGGSPSLFSRLFYIPNLNLPNDDVRAVVKVLWNEGSVSNEVDLSSELTNVNH